MYIFCRKKELLLFFVLLAVFAATVLFFGSFSARHVFQPIYQGGNARKSVAFTVNVDWGEEYLDKMLNIFAKNKIKATFFITGRWAEANPQLVKKIARAGHEVGNHGFSHPHVNNISLGENIAEINKTKDSIYALTGKRTRFYAPPYGEFNDTVLEAAHQTNHRTILWTIDTVDWQKPAPEQVTARVLDMVHNGAIILMHPTETTLTALPDIYRGLKEQGYRVETLEKLIAE